MSLVHYTVGDGPRHTVLLHGFLGSGRNLRSLAVRWAEADPTRRFLVPDLPGHGTSPPLQHEEGLDDVARAVLATADAAGLSGPLSLTGHSLGGRVGLAVLRIAPERLTDLVLLDIGPGPIDPARSDSRTVLDVLLDAPNSAADRRELRAFLLGRGLTPALSDWVLMNVEAHEGRVRWRIDRQALSRLHTRFNADDLWPVVMSSDVPIRCVRGALSSYVSDEEAQRLTTAGCPVDTLPQAGHFVHVDALEALVANLCAH